MHIGNVSFLLREKYTDGEFDSGIILLGWFCLHFEKHCKLWCVIDNKLFPDSLQESLCTKKAIK